jgi:LysM repeat protein
MKMVRKERRYAYTTSAAQARPRAVSVRRRPLSRVDRLAIAGAGLVFAFVVLLGLLAGAFYAYYSLFDLVLPGTRAGEIALGGLSVDAAVQRLEREWQTAGRLAISDGNRSWAISAAELGFALDARATAQQAYQSGRAESGWPSPFAFFQEPEKIAPRVTFQPDAARARLQSAAALIDVAPVEASVRFAGGQWLAVPGSAGLSLAVEETINAWAADPSGVLRSGTLPVQTRAVAPAHMDASAEVERLNAMMRAPLYLRAFDPVTGETLDVTVPPEALAEMVRVGEGGGSPQITLDAGAFQAFLQTWQGGLGAERYLDEVQGLDNLVEYWQSGTPLDARVRYHPTSYTVQPGDTLLSISYEIGIPWFLIRDANPGSGTNGLVAGEQITLPARDANMPLPVVRGKRIVISISQQRLWSYQDGQLRTQSVISTGIARSPTMPGVFQIRSHDVNAYASNWDLWMPNFMGIYEASPGFMNGIHGLPLLSSGVRLWGNVLGSPASYGCIIMTLAEAEELYQWADEGTVVEIQP